MDSAAGDSADRRADLRTRRRYAQSCESRACPYRTLQNVKRANASAKVLFGGICAGP
jgi:hypothetical protein